MAHATFALALMLVLGCGESEGDAPRGPVLTLERVGGLCPYGLCATTLTLDASGSFVITDGAGLERRGSIDGELVSDIAREAAQADWAALRAVEFTDVCPTAYDGQELRYRFHTTGGDEEIASCEHVVDETAQPFRAVQQALDAIAALDPN